MKEPTYNDAEKCANLRKLSKLGTDIGEEGRKFCTSMFKKYLDWYKKASERVFNETVPFGSNRKYRKALGNES